MIFLPDEMPPLGKLEIGQEVTIIKTGDRPRTAVVTKIGRVWVDLAETENYWRTWRMRMDTQRETADANARTYEGRFRTAKQQAWVDAVKRTDDFLAERGIDVRRGQVWDTPSRRLCLAELICGAEREFENEGP